MRRKEELRPAWKKSDSLGVWKCPPVTANHDDKRLDDERCELIISDCGE